jgi:malate dehydrogenase
MKKKVFFCTTAEFLSSNDMPLIVLQVRCHPIGSRNERHRSFLIFSKKKIALSHLMLHRTALRSAKVAVLGAAGGIGQPLSMLLKNSPLVTELTCYDIVNAVGVATDLSHISSPAKVTGYIKEDLPKALAGAELVIIPAGVPRKPGMTRDDLFNTNASIVKNLVEACAKACPNAIIGIIANPVNSTVPIAAEVLKAAGVYDPRKLFGITTLDIVRAKTFIAAELGVSPFDINVTVVGGHSGPTIVPLITQSGFKISEEKLKAITHRIQYGGDEVVKAKDGTGSATLSMAYAGAEFAFSALKALRGDQGIVECTFVQSDVDKRVPFFSTRVELGKNGVEKIHPIGPVTPFEADLVEKCIEELSKNIQKGIEFGKR